MENIFSIDTEPDGSTTIVTQSRIRLTLSPEASAELADHLLNALHVSITLAPHGRYKTSVRPNDETDLARLRRDAG